MTRAPYVVTAPTYAPAALPAPLPAVPAPTYAPTGVPAEEHKEAPKEAPNEIPKELPAELFETSRLARPRTRRVRFVEGAAEVHEIVAYSEVYGVHPRDFVFTRGYHMVPAVNFVPIDVLAARFREGCAPGQASAPEPEDEEAVESDDEESDWEIESDAE